MGYLEDLQTQINNRDFSKFWQLWEEYCTSEDVDVEEFKEILKSIKNSDFTKLFGQYVETALPLWETIKDPSHSYQIIKFLLDLQTTNSAKLADIAIEALKNKYNNQPEFNERLRLVGLRTRDNFQGCLSNFDLLAHMQKGKFVFHTGGWGAGEIVDLSPVREQVGIEFENITGRKYFSFANAFKNLLPLADSSFLARRFSNPDDLEKDAKENPVEIITLLLKDLGPKTAVEIKDELCDLVIPEKDWSKWWQAARAKLKKNTMIETPESIKAPFRLRKAEVTHEERLHKAISLDNGVDDLIQTAYSFTRDNPNMLKKAEVKDPIKEKLANALSSFELSKAQQIQIHLILEILENKNQNDSLVGLLQDTQDFATLLDQVQVIAFKKKVLTLVRQHRKDWEEIFSGLLFTPQQSTLRDYLLKELNQGNSRKLLIEKLRQLSESPLQAPEFLVWYFQKLIGKDHKELPFGDKQGQGLFFESLLILLSAIEPKPEFKELAKKIYVLLSGKRYAVVRQVIEGTTFEYINEFLLLAAKCQSFTSHDQKILRSLAEVVHPELNPGKNRKDQSHTDSQILWTTEEGYNKTKNRLQSISTVEMVENAREIEAARALGDLRENSEYKFALEKRSRLQGELKYLSSQLSGARIITPDDISKEEVGIGSIVNIQDSKGNQLCYTILGPWDADADKGILSAQSKLAQAMFGKQKGEIFIFKDEEYLITDFKSFLE